ncbi:MAG: TonB-dependent receptor plug domain-containing protein, partial [Flavobacteriales bacterium]
MSNTTLAQQTLITANYENTQASHILKDWSRDYAMRFAYDSYELARCKGDWSFKDAKPDEALRNLLAPCGFTFQFSNGQYLIYRSLNTSPKELEVPSPQPDEPCRITIQVKEAVSGEPIPFAAAQWVLDGRGMTGDQTGQIHLPCSAKSDDSLAFYALGYYPLVLPASEFQKSNASKFKVEMIQESGLMPPIVVDDGYLFSIQSRGFPRQFIMKPNQSALRYGLGEQDIFRAVQMMPGVGATMELSQGIYLRGSPLDQTLVVLDDFTIYHADHLFGTFSAVNANAIQNARLNRDMGDARWGGRAAGVLDMVAREGDRKHIQSRIDMGALSSGIALGGPLDAKGKAVFMVTGRRAFTDFFYSNTFKKLFNTLYSSSTKTGVADGFRGGVPPKFSFQDINAKLTYRPTNRDIMHVSYYASADQLYVQYADTGNVSAGDFLDAKYTDESIKRNNGASIRWNREISSNWSFGLSSGYSRFEGSYFSSDTLSNFLLATDSAQFSSQIFGVNDWTTRAEWTRNVSHVSDCFGLQFTQLSTQNRTNERGVLFDTLLMRSSSLAGYWSRLWTLRNWKIQGGGRVTWYEPFRKFYPEPRLNVSYRALEDKIELSGGMSRVHQFVQLTT